MKDAYLTIDDTPTAHSLALGELLITMEAPALFFLRGQRMEDNPDPVPALIQRGFVMGNHLYSHQRASQLSFEEIISEITRTETLIDAAYRQAGIARPGKYLRFPHIDRGTGGWVIDYDAVPAAYRDMVIKIFTDGLNISLEKPAPALIEKKHRLQDWLRAEGFTPPPLAPITHKWYRETEMADALDWLYSYSTADWMLTTRHRGKWPYKSIADLCQKIDDDPHLQQSDSAHIILLHDDPDNLVPVTKALLNHLRHNGFRFKNFP